MQQRMYFPDRANTETDRQRLQRLALQKRVERDVKHRNSFTHGRQAIHETEAVEPIAELRPKAGLVMTFGSFKAADRRQILQILRVAA